MKHTLGTAAKATGVSKPTIQRAIKSGKISATKNDLGQWQIDPAELHRVYPPVTDNSNGNGTVRRDVTTNDNSVLQVKLEILEEERERERRQLEQTISDLKKERDDWKEQAQNATRLLTHQQEQPQQRSFRDWLFGRSGPRKPGTD